MTEWQSPSYAWVRAFAILWACCSNASTKKSKHIFNEFFSKELVFILDRAILFRAVCVISFLIEANKWCTHRFANCGVFLQFECDNEWHIDILKNIEIGKIFLRRACEKLFEVLSNTEKHASASRKYDNVVSFWEHQSECLLHIESHGKTDDDNLCAVTCMKCSLFVYDTMKLLC